MAFLLVFGSSALLGRVDSLEIILFLIGLGLLAVEIFVLPGFGVVGISGIVFIGLSLVLSMQDFVIPRFDWEWEVLGRNAMVVFLSFVASVIGIVVIALAGPKVRMFDRIMLKAAITGTAGGPDPDSPAMKAYEASKPAGTNYSSQSGMAFEDEEVFLALVGKSGVTDSVLRPAGRALIEGRIYTVEADGEFVEEGKDITVTRVRGNRIIVRKV
jgi:membrane-bound serine protease (ClpP class)